MRLLLSIALFCSVFCHPAFAQKAVKDFQPFYGVIKVKRSIRENKPHKETAPGVMGDESVTTRKVNNWDEEWTFDAFFYNDLTGDVAPAPLTGEDLPDAVPLVSRTKQTTNLTPLINDDLPEAVPLAPGGDRVTARLTASGDSLDETVSAATNVICWRDDGTAVHGANRTVTTTGKTNWTANRVEEARASLSFKDNGEYTISLAAKAKGSAINERTEKLKSTCGNKTLDEQKVTLPWEITLEFTSDPFKGTPSSGRLTGKEILVLGNGTLEVQWELRRRP
jgi:hypothetical protein